jgi:outer membrane biosynthesis protein TonB
MSKVVAVCYRNYELPWTIAPEERARLQRIFKHILGVLGVLAILMPFLPVREVDRTAAPEMPQRFARLVAERKPPPPPPVVKEQPKPVEAVQPKPEASAAVEPPKPQAETRPVPAPREKPAAAQVRDAPADGAGNGTDVAREKAARAGLVAFADQLADLRDSKVVAGATASRPLNDAVGPGPRAERSLVTSAAGKGSGGINTVALSRNTGGGGGGQGFGSLEGRAITQVAGPAGLGSSVAAAGEARAAASEGRRLQRSREEIELVFDRNKGAIYALYHRALREDPTLQGKLVLKLTIAASGKVTSCEVVSSELNAPELERKLVQRVLLFDFGAKDVEEITTTKPIDFFPA